MNKSFKILSDYFIIALSSFLLAISVNCFLVPLKLSTGGVSGIGTILYYIFEIPLSVTTLAVNAILFIFGYKILDKSSIAKTIFGVVILSVSLEITAKFGTYSEDVLIASIFGGILVGIGVGLTVYRDASTGGSDFAALIIHGILPHISLAKVILFIDFAIITVSGIAFKNYTITFYSIISLYISSKVTDRILVSGNFAKSVYIISKYNNSISSDIIADMKRGVTGISVRGKFNNADSEMLMCVVRNKEIPHLMKLIKSHDSNAFVIISDVREVHGRGFKEG